MKRYSMILYLLLFVTFKVCSQVIISIDSISLSQIDVNVKPNIISEGEKDGPYVFIYYCIRNETEKPVILSPKKSIMFLRFNHNDLWYEKELSPSLLNFDSIIIKPGEKYCSKVGNDIFLGTDILTKKNKYSYLLELLETIPTLKIEYSQNGLKLFSCGITKVIISRP